MVPIVRRGKISAEENKSLQRKKTLYPAPSHEEIKAMSVDQNDK
jgi:hypothetical protein